MAVLVNGRMPRVNKSYNPKTDDIKDISTNPGRSDVIMIFLGSGLVILQTVVAFMSYFPRFSFGFFTNGMKKVYNIFRVNISPSGIFFFIPIFSQIGQLGIILYTILSLWRRTPRGPRLTNPNILSVMFFILWNMATTLNMVWCFVFDKLFFPEASVLLASSLMALVPAFGIVSSRLAYFQPQLKSEKRVFELMSLRWGVLNSLAMQIAQTVVNLFIQATMMTSAAFSRTEMMELVSSISLGIMTMLTLVFTVMDVTVLEPYTRFVLTPYLTMGGSVVGMIQGGWNVSNSSSILKACAVTSCVSGFILKTSVSVYNRNKTFNGDRMTTKKQGVI